MKKGFTLVEMLVVIAIIALMSALAVPSIKAMNESHKQSAANNLITAAIRQGRNYAIAHQKPSGIYFELKDLEGRQKIHFITTEFNWHSAGPDGIVGNGDDAFAYYPEIIPESKELVLPVGYRVWSSFADDPSLDNDIKLLGESSFAIIFSGSGMLEEKRIVPSGLPGGTIVLSRNGLYLVDNEIIKQLPTKNRFSSYPFLKVKIINLYTGNFIDLE